MCTIIIIIMRLKFKHNTRTPCFSLFSLRSLFKNHYCTRSSNRSIYLTLPRHNVSIPICIRSTNKPIFFCFFLFVSEFKHLPVCADVWFYLRLKMIKKAYCTINGEMQSGFHRKTVSD